MATDKLKEIAANIAKKAGAGHQTDSAIGGLSAAVMQKQTALIKDQTHAMDGLNDELKETSVQAHSILGYEKEIQRVRKESTVGVGKYADKMNSLGKQSKSAASEVKKMDDGILSFSKNIGKFRKDNEKYEKTKGGLFGSILGGAGDLAKSAARGVIEDHLKASTIYTKNLYQLENMTDIAAKGNKGYAEVLARVTDKSIDYVNVIDDLNETGSRFGYTLSDAVDEVERMDNVLRMGPAAAKKAADGVFVYSKVLGIGKEAASAFYDQSINGFGMTADAARDSLADIRIEIDKTNSAYKNANLFVDDMAKAVIDLRDQSASGNINLRLTASVLTKTAAEAEKLGLSYNNAKKTATSLGELLQKPPPWVQYYAGKRMASGIVTDLKNAAGNPKEQDKIIEKQYGDILKDLDPERKQAKIDQIKRLALSGSYSDLMTLQEVVAGSQKSMTEVFEQIKKFGSGPEGTQILMEQFGVKDRVQADAIRQMIRDGKIAKAIKEIKQTGKEAPLETSKTLEKNLPASIEAVGSKINESNGLLGLMKNSLEYLENTVKAGVINRLFGQGQVGSNIGKKIFTTGVGALGGGGVGSLINSLVGFFGGDKDTSVGSALAGTGGYIQDKSKQVADVAHDNVIGGAKQVAANPTLDTVASVAKQAGTGLATTFAPEIGGAKTAYNAAASKVKQTAAAKIAAEVSGADVNSNYLLEAFKGINAKMWSDILTALNATSLEKISGPGFAKTSASSQPAASGTQTGKMSIKQNGNIVITTMQNGAQEINAAADRIKTSQQ